jgi:hypothetical protein
MNKKKLGSIALLLVVLFSILTIPVLAADTTTEANGGGFMDTVIKFLSSTSVTIGIIGMVSWAIFKAGSKIFKEGIYFKTELVSKKEMREFEEGIRNDIRGYRIELQKVVLDTCMREIKAQLKDVDEIKKNSQKMIEIRVSLEEKLKHLDAKYDEVRGYGASVKSLIDRVHNLETTDKNETRRHE